MSSILDALKELESERARGAKKTTSVANVPSAPPRSFGMMTALGGGLALGVVALGVYLWGAGTKPQQPIEAASVEQPARSASEQAPAPGRGPEWLGRAEPPRARVAPVAPAAAPAPAPTPRAAVAEAPPPVVPAAPSPAAVVSTPIEPAVAPAPVERAAATTPVERPAPPIPPVPAAAPAATPQTATVPAAAVPSAPARPAPARPAEAPVRRAGNQDVQMEALAFSSHAHQRTVTLLVDGRRATLHQGESLGGVEVQLIMADGAYLQRSGDVVFIGKPR
jgi:hypothetical protein